MVGGWGKSGECMEDSGFFFLDWLMMVFMWAPWTTEHLTYTFQLNVQNVWRQMFTGLLPFIRRLQMMIQYQRTCLLSL